MNIKLLNILIIAIVLYCSFKLSLSNEEVYYDSTYLNSIITDPKNPCMNVVCTDQFPGQCNVRAGQIFFARNTAVGICCGVCMEHKDLDPETEPPK
ncbi:hypothetical protein DDB_G0284907 [Dictyostelium discoideum AX4]|uniref:Uncharacterized protein n=1 Tax=Dictyostelium discoideum TaxID=44689 RepID=Q54NZ3_DICDI|nr:hypothetical protein DDB_G0284907 [Dictyostelium discoideum AX4]EAL64917.1 hypothetical protein DDB_G0284907 [Dictyostelium discoideum AX4]|eukprot:XP_639924.1 hypothetical protein DDB_G0284907 [Dictyostelium discoideum AX4]